MAAVAEKRAVSLFLASVTFSKIGVAGIIIVKLQHSFHLDYSTYTFHTCPAPVFSSVMYFEIAAQVLSNISELTKHLYIQISTKDMELRYLEMIIHFAAPLIRHHTNIIFGVKIRRKKAHQLRMPRRGIFTRQCSKVAAAVL